MDGRDNTEKISFSFEEEPFVSVSHLGGGLEEDEIAK